MEKDFLEPDYNYFREKYVGTYYGDLRRERKKLMERMIFSNDATVKPRIRELTIAMFEYIKEGTQSGRTSGKNPPMCNYPSAVRRPF